MGKTIKMNPADNQAEVKPKEETIKEESQAEVGPGKIFDFADVYFYCNACGTDNKIADALRGVSFTVPAAEKAEVKFECSNCKNMMKLHFIESSEEAKEKRRIEIAEQEAAHKAQKESNGTSQENTEVESGQAGADSTERPIESNEQADGNTADVDAVGSPVEA